MSQKLQVVQAFDRALVTEIPADDSPALETKLGSALSAILFCLRPKSGL
jgi:hypothetical protein